ETATQLARFPSPQIGFNYLGRFAAGAESDWAVAPETNALGHGGDPKMPLAHALEINAVTVDGPGGPTLSATWSFAPALLSEQAVGDLAQLWFRALEALVRHASQPGSGGRSPCDFTLVSLTQAQIERLERGYPQIEDVLPLSPLQEGLLFHALYDAQGDDIYITQVVLDLDGPLETARMQRAAQTLLRRHASLRAGFVHANLPSPVQLTL